MADSDSDVSFEADDDDMRLPLTPRESRGAPIHGAAGRGHQPNRNYSDTSDDIGTTLRRTAARPSLKSWQDVDRDELGKTVLKLISSVASTAPTDDKSRDAVWHPTSSITVTAELVDPLGLGRINPDTLTLERDRPTDAAAGSSRSPGVGGKSANQSKGVVGRFFQELTRSADTVSGAAGAAAGKGTMPLLSDAGAASGRYTSGGSKAAGLPLHMLLPTEEGFQPEAYLAVFHEGTSAAQLAAGSRALERELGEGAGQLKQLVKQNFDRFISCKTTIDDIYVKLQRIESETAGVSTEVLFNAITEVQDLAAGAFGPILERAAKAERLKGVLALLRRFQGLFAMPQRITAAAAARDYEQVVAEYKKAVSLIKPGPRTAKVWVSLYGEIEKRVSEVYQQLQGELQDSELPAALAPDLVLYMLQLQSEGLAAAAGKDPLALFLEAREGQFRSEVDTAVFDHQQTMGSLAAQAAAASGDKAAKQDPQQLPAAALLHWGGMPQSPRGGISSPRSPLSHPHPQPGSPSRLGSPNHAAAPAAGGGGAHGGTSSSGSSSGGRPRRQAAAAGAGGSRPGAKGRQAHVLAALSGLRPPPLRSHLVDHTWVTPVQSEVLRHLARLSSCLLDCLPGVWQVTGTARLAKPPSLPAAVAGQLQSTLTSASALADRLVDRYCQEVGALVTLMGQGQPLQAAQRQLVQELAQTLAALRKLQAPSSALSNVEQVLQSAVASAVQLLANHLRQAPAALMAHEDWSLTLTESNNDLVTHLPDQLQEEVTVVMQYYKSLLSAAAAGAAAGGGGGGKAKAVAAHTKELQAGYFGGLEELVSCCSAAAEELRPGTSAASSPTKAAAGASGDASEAAAGKGRGSPAPQASSSPTRGRQKDAWSVWESDEEEGGREGSADKAAAAGGGILGGGPGALLGQWRVRGAVSEDAKLLVLTSNLGYVRNVLLGNMTQRFLLLLTGERGAEVDRCGAAVSRLAAKLDKATKAQFAIYLERKRASLGRALRAYARPDGAAVGVPPDLRDVSPQAMQLVGAVVGVQAEVLQYAREALPSLLPRLLVHLAGALPGAFSALDPAAAPVEAAAQHFLDVVFLEAVLGPAGPATMSVDFSAAQQLLAARIVGQGPAGVVVPRDRSAAVTALARSLLAVKDPEELQQRLLVTCRRVVRPVLQRCAVSIRSLVPSLSATELNSRPGSSTGGAAPGSTGGVAKG